MTLPRTEQAQFEGPAGVLEGLIDMPDETAHGGPPTCFAVVCHPHPLQSGTMHNKVAHTLARSLAELGCSCIRFNFRGAGGSAGSYGEGIGETEDALAVIAAGRARWPGAELTLAGFSFGGVVALRAALSAGAQRLITVAPAVDRVPLQELPAKLPPWLLIQGLDDEVVPQPRVQAWVEALPVPPQCVWLPEVGHFFHGALTPLKRAVQDFVRGTNPAVAPIQQAPAQ